MVTNKAVRTVIFEQAIQSLPQASTSLRFTAKQTSDGFIIRRQVNTVIAINYAIDTGLFYTDYFSRMATFEPDTIGKPYFFYRSSKVFHMTLTDQKAAAFIDSAAIEWETVGKGVQRKILGYDDALMMVLVRFEKGAIGSLHHHVHRQISYVGAGSFEVTIDGKKQVLKAGDCFFVAPDLVHGVVALEPGTLVDVFTPARQDFLP